MKERNEMLPDDDDSEVTPEVADAALRLLLRDFTGPARAEAERRLRALLLEEHWAAGGRIPKWLMTPAAKRVSDDVNDGL